MEINKNVNLNGILTGNKIFLKSNSQSNNQNNTLIVDSSKSDKVKAEFSKRHTPSINFNQHNSNNKNDGLNFSRKSSPYNKITSDILYSNFNLIKNMAKKEIIQQIGVKLNEDRYKKFSINSNIAVPIFEIKKIDSESHNLKLETEIPNNGIEVLNNKFVSNLHHLKNCILSGKKHSTTANSPKNQSSFKKDAAVNNNYIQTTSKYFQQNIINNHESLRIKEDVRIKPIISTKLNLNDLKLKKVEEEKRLEEKKKSENSLDHILETSNCSVKSTGRECNYYNKESEKLSKYIKKCLNCIKIDYLKNNEYPSSNLKFYKYGRVIFALR